MSDQNGNFQHMLRWRQLSISTHFSYWVKAVKDNVFCISFFFLFCLVHCSPSAALAVCGFLTLAFCYTTAAHTTDTFIYQSGWLRANVPQPRIQWCNTRTKLICFVKWRQFLFLSKKINFFFEIKCKCVVHWYGNIKREQTIWNQKAIIRTHKKATRSETHTNLISN